MKRTFLRILPLAVAVLLATSCNKDENNDNNVVNNGQENVVVKEKTVSVSGTIDKKTSISKLACADGVITFEGTETINFSGDDGKIHGSTTVAENGSFTVDLSYPADQALDYLDNKSLTATIGTAPTNATGAYDDINAAVKDIYETGTTTIKVEATPDFSGSGTSYSVSLVPLTINVEVAFVKNEKSEAIDVSVNEGVAVSLAGGKICIVPAGAKITADGNTKSETVAGEIYTIEAAASYVDLGIVVGGKNVYFEKKESYPTSTWTALNGANKLGDLPTKAEWKALSDNCYWRWDATKKGYYVFMAKAEQDKGKKSYDNPTLQGTYSEATDPYLFLPAAFDDGDHGVFCSGESGYGFAYFFVNFVYHEYDYGVDDVCSVLTVRRSN